LKGTTRAKRGKGFRRHVVAEARLPNNWMDFLRVDHNKTELFKFLYNALLDSFSLKEKQFVVTDEELVLSKPPPQDLISLSLYSHEEADSRMLLHAHHAAHHGHPIILIHIVDTDVVILSLYIAQVL